MSTKIYTSSIEDLKKKIDETCEVKNVASIEKNDSTNLNISLSSFKDLVKKIEKEVDLTSVAIVSKNQNNLNLKKNKP